MYPSSPDSNQRTSLRPDVLDASDAAVVAEHLPLAFPRSRWASFGTEDRARFNRAQRLLDAVSDRSAHSVFAVHEDTGLDQAELGEALALLEDLGLITLDESEQGLSVLLVATPEEHIGVRFPDGQVHWVFVSRPVVEPDVAPEDLN
jgi:hypothetical protein